MYRKVINWFDAPQVLDASVKNIPGSNSLPYQVIAKTFGTITEVFFVDTTGKFIGVYVGDVGEEVLIAILGGIPHTIPAVVGPNQRISIRNMDVSPITSGGLMCSFHG